MKFTFVFHFWLSIGTVNGAFLRESTDRMSPRSLDTDATAADHPTDWKVLQDINADAAELIAMLQGKEGDLPPEEEIAILELLDVLVASVVADGMSMGPTNPPTVSTQLSMGPTMTVPSSPSMAPIVPTTAPPIPTAVPTNSSTDFPTLSMAPSGVPTNDTIPTAIPTTSFAPTNSSTFPPTTSMSPSITPTAAPSVSPRPTDVVTGSPTNGPTLTECQSTPEERVAAIMAILDQVADSILIRDRSTSQGLATEWILNEDDAGICPDDPKIIQRWALAVMYFSTGGNNWTECFAGDENCTNSLIYRGEDAFLSPSDECEWAGIACDVEGCVTEIEFEDNNFVGTIPTELGLLKELFVWGMERGNLTGPIPSEIGSLSNLIFIDLDFNKLTGTLPTELYDLLNVTQLDLNNNFFSGDVSGIGNFVDLQFLQLHSNRFTGTIPEQVGTFEFLSTFTLHDTDFTGIVPAGLCDLIASGTLVSMISDCAGPTPEIECDCCTDCRPVSF